jgi:hypothetical protein
LIREYHIFIDIEIPITKAEIMIMSLKVLRQLDKANANPILKYKVMYHNTENNLRIRSDNGHIENGQRYPHIDLEMPDMEKKKMVFDTDPSDYEASINTVLRYAERYSNPMVGVNYWLRNLVTFKTDLIYFLFNNQKRFAGTSTAFTDVAKLVSADIWTNGGETIYDFEALNKLTAHRFVFCRIYEQTKHRPLKISKNLIQQNANTNLFPCPIFMDSSDGPLKHGPLKQSFRKQRK